MSLAIVNAVSVPNVNVVILYLNGKHYIEKKLHARHNSQDMELRGMHRLR